MPTASLFVFLKIFSFFPEEKTKHNLNPEESFQFKKKKKKAKNRTKNTQQVKKHQKSTSSKIAYKK